MRTKLIGSIALLSILALAGCGSSDGASAGNQLSSLTISPGTLSPTFASTTKDYTVSVANDVTSVTVTPTAKDSGATIKVNDVAVTSDQASGSINVPGTITIIVTPKGGGATYTYIVTVTQAAPGIGDIGGACQCPYVDTKDNSCYEYDLTDEPFPADGNGADITNCDVPSGISGAVKLCLRSYDFANSIGGELTGMTLPNTYFAGGYCSMGATKCAFGQLCTFGEYDALTTCPTGSVMIQDEMAILVSSSSLALKSRICAKPCNDINDCRQNDEPDPVWNDNGGYTCSANDDKCKNSSGSAANTETFCYDPRNLTPNCKVTKF